MLDSDTVCKLQILELQVIHTLGPAQSSNRRRTQKMPSKPYPTHQNPNPTHQNPTDTAATTQAAASHAEAPNEQCYFEALCLQKMCWHPPKFTGLDRIPRWKNQSKDIMTIWRRVIVMHTVLTTLTQEGVVMAYALFPLQGSQMPSEAFHCDRIRCLIQDNIFMHDGTLTIHAKFQNPFILYLVRKLIWNTRFQLDNLFTMPRKQLHYAMGLAGTGHKMCAGQTPLHSRLFAQTWIASAVEEKADLNQWKDHIVVCGVSQQCVRVELSDFDLLDPDLDPDSDITDDI
ncbi:hypothetical protein F4604DRAFT_1922753 [Suillus subluteus]|nr:hypothetical protein F4604DRAFT_1922753 [Suillus subluteus]